MVLGAVAVPGVEVQPTDPQVPAREQGTCGLEASLDKGVVSQPHAGGREAVGHVESFGQGHCSPAGVDSLVELPEFCETACEPGKADRLMRVPGADHAEGTRPS